MNICEKCIYNGYEQVKLCLIKNDIEALASALFGCSEYMPKPDKVDDEGRTLNGCEQEKK